MQTNLNCNCPKPQFGMAINSNENVSKILIKRIKKDADADKLQKLFRKQEANNKVDITLLQTIMAL